MIDQPSWCKVAEVELVYKTKVKASERLCVRSSHDSYCILKEIWDENKINMLEQFKVLLLNRANRVVGVYQASSGAITGTIAYSRLILATFFHRSWHYRNLFSTYCSYRKTNKRIFYKKKYTYCNKQEGS